MLPSLIMGAIALGIIVGLMRFTMRAFEESPYRLVAALLAVAGYVAIGYGVKAVLTSAFPIPQVTPGDLSSLHRAQVSIYALWAASALVGSAAVVVIVMGVQSRLGGVDVQGGGVLVSGVLLGIVCGAVATFAAARWGSAERDRSLAGASHAGPAPDATANAQVSDDAWILGTWQLAFDPDNSPTDYMVFGPGNRFESKQAGEAQGIVGTFVLANTALHVSVPIRDKTLKLEFQVSASKERLTKADGAYYAKAVTPIPQSSIFKSPSGSCPADYFLESGYCVHGGVATPTTAGQLVEDYRKGVAPPPIPH